MSTEEAPYVLPITKTLAKAYYNALEIILADPEYIYYQGYTKDAIRSLWWKKYDIKIIGNDHRTFRLKMEFKNGQDALAFILKWS